MTNISRGGSAAFALLFAVSASGGACAMTSTPSEQLRCIVQGADKLPEGIGAETICTAIRRATEPVLQRHGLSPDSVAVSVEVRSESGFSATPSVGGTALRERHVVTSNRPLTQSAVDMLARAVAAELSTVADQ